MKRCNDKITNEVIMISNAKIPFSSSIGEEQETDNDDDTRRFGWCTATSIAAVMVVDANQNFMFLLSLNAFKEFLVNCCNLTKDESKCIVSSTLQIEDLIRYETILELYQCDCYKPSTIRIEPNLLMADGFKLYHALTNVIEKTSSSASSPSSSSAIKDLSQLKKACAVIECLYKTFMMEIPKQRLRKKPKTN